MELAKKGRAPMKKQTRSEARQEAFVLVFQLNQQGEEMQQILSQLPEERPQCQPNMEYIKAVVLGVQQHEQELMELLSLCLSKDWKIQRIAKVPLAILKLAAYEMKYMEDVPPRVAINEAVELAKQYGEEDDPAFVNGVLGAVYKTL
jgi:N utilization substance protein B